MKIDKVFPSLHATRKVLTGVLFGLDVKTLKADPQISDVMFGLIVSVGSSVSQGGQSWLSIDFFYGSFRFSR